MALKSLTHFITFFTLFSTIRSVPLAHRAEPGTCLSGSCSFKLVQPATTNGEPSEGSLVLDGSPNLISDITESAGWSSWDCEEGPEGHTIRLVCTGSDDTCNHVFQGGAEDTIVRVPSECKIGPYARIAASWDPKKLAIPNKINTVLGLKKDSPRVYAFRLDTNFGAIPTNKGNVSFAATATNIGLQDGALTVHQLRRSLQDRSDIEARGSIITTFFDSILGKIEQSTTVHTGKNGTLNIDFSQSNIPILNASEDCGGIGGAVHVSLDASVKGQVKFGYAVVGSLVPLHIEDFGIYSGLSGSIASTFHVQADSRASFISPSVNLFQSGLPMLDFPGVVTVGPAVQLSAQLKADAALSAKSTLSGNYQIPAIEFVYPPRHAPSRVSMKASKGPLQLQWAGELEAMGTVEATLTPKAMAGLSFFNGKYHADIYVSLDAGPSLIGQAALMAEGNIREDAASVNSSLHAKECAALNANMHVRAGVAGSFQPFFDKDWGVDLYNKSYEVWKRCKSTTPASQPDDFVSLSNTTSTSSTTDTTPPPTSSLAPSNSALPEGVVRYYPVTPQRRRSSYNTNGSSNGTTSGLSCAPSIHFGPGISVVV